MLHDITPLITPSLAVFPGDTPASREILLDMKRGDNITLSTLRATVHLGAHADAPSHYGRDAVTMEAVSLAPYLGPCQVIRVAAKRSARITAAQLPRAVTRPRILLATGTFPDPDHFNKDFAALDPGLVDALHDQGVILIGLDTPSVDLSDSKGLPAHQRFLVHGMAILEGLVLKEVPEGDYELIALPLRLAGFDGSPVRAILRPLA